MANWLDLKLSRPPLPFLIAVDGAWGLALGIAPCKAQVIQASTIFTSKFLWPAT